MPPSKENTKDDKEAIIVESGPNGNKEIKGKKGKNGENVEELSEEDETLKEGLELAVTRLQENDTSLHKQALDHLVNEIRSATSSMTSVPKPLKFLNPHYATLKDVYEKWPGSHDMKKMMADMMSVLAMTMSDKGSFECLKFKLAGTQVNISSWGHEYVRYLSGEISEEYNRRILDEAELAEEDTDTTDLLELVDDIVPFQMSHNAEAEAADLLIECQQLNKLVSSEPPVVDERNYERICLYLLRSADFMSLPEDLYNIFMTCYSIYKSQKKFIDALRVCLKMDDDEAEQRITELFAAVDENIGTEKGQYPADGPLVSSINIKKQMALVLGRHRSHYVVPDEMNSAFDVKGETKTLNTLVGNVDLSELFTGVARDMDVLVPKTAEAIYKITNPSNRRGVSNAPVDSARANLATSYVNGFANAGCCKDTLMTEDGTAWIRRNKDHGMMSATASLGMVMMWSVDEGLQKIDNFLRHPTEPFIRAGALLGIGVMSSGVRNESDAALAVLADYIDDPSTNIRNAVYSGLGIAYAGARKEELCELLMPVIENVESTITECSLAVLSLGISFVGSCNYDIAEAVIMRMMLLSIEDLNHTSSRFLCLGLALLFLGKQEKADIIIETVRVIEHARGKYAEICLETCAYAGTGNVLQVQKMLKICAERLTEEAEHQAVAVLGIALVTVGEEIGAEMTLRTFEHLLQYAELPVRRIVPLAIALLYISNPDYTIVDQLSRLSHDVDSELAQGAILALGLVSAGTNNSRVAGLLRALSEFYAKEASNLFIVRIAQGLCASSKGLTTLSPFHSDRLLLNGPALAGLLTVLHATIDVKNTLLAKMDYVLYYLACSTNPRFMTTMTTDMEPVQISVRVGLAVETVGQAGRPKTITGFQTHTSPVLVGAKERTELANREYITINNVLEGCVLVEKAPEEEEEEP